jgi:limonene-1,2-epoxide hydrolase
MRAAYETILDWRFRITAIHGDDRTVMVEFDGAGHFTGSFHGREIRRVPLRLAAVCVFELAGGRIVAVREYLDVTGRDRQLGEAVAEVGGMPTP